MLLIPMEILELLALFIRPSVNLTVGVFRLSRSDKRSVFDDTKEDINMKFCIIYRMFDN